MKEVRIIGGGPAGLVLGILLRREGVPVRVWEAGKYPRHKICGEFFAPRNPGLVKELKLEAVMEHCPEARSVAWMPTPRARRAARFSLPHPARVVTRHHFDASLRELLLELGGVVEDGVRENGIAGEGVVRAAGRERSSGPCEWIGLKAHFEGLRVGADLEMHTGTGAYVGVCEVGGGAVNVSGLFRAAKIAGGNAREWTALLERHGLRELARRISAARMLPGTLCSVSHLQFGWNSCTREIRVGDARAVIPPLAGNGLSMAMEMAGWTAPVLARWAAGAISWDAAVRNSWQVCSSRLARRLKWAKFAQALLMARPSREIFGCLAAVGGVPWRRAFLLLGG